MSEHEDLAASSWILEVRRKLAEPPPAVLVRRGSTGDGGGEAAPPAAAGLAPKRAAAMVPLFVDAGQLWTVITERVQRVAGHRSPPAFPGALLAGGADVWQAALSGGEREAGLYPQAALDLGRLDQVATPAGVVVTPCVAAIPETALRKREEPAEEAGVEDVVPVPLAVLARPQLVERRPVEMAGEPREILILHVGRHRIWGVTAAIVVNLLARLGFGSPES
jgi:hypothetical protein